MLFARAALGAEFLQTFYASPKAIKDTYSCCVYRGKADADFDCKEQDLECAEDYNDIVTIYFVISVCAFGVALLLCIISCVRARHREVVERSRKVKKAPILETSADPMTFS